MVNNNWSNCSIDSSSCKERENNTIEGTLSRNWQIKSIGNGKNCQQVYDLQNNYNGAANFANKVVDDIVTETKPCSVTCTFTKAGPPTLNEKEVSHNFIRVKWNHGSNNDEEIIGYRVDLYKDNNQRW